MKLYTLTESAATIAAALQATDTIGDVHDQQ